MTKAVFFLMVNLVLAFIVFSLNTTVFTLIGIFLLVEGAAIFIFRWVHYYRERTADAVKGESLK